MDSDDCDTANQVSRQSVESRIANTDRDQFAALRNLAQTAEPFAHVPTSGYSVGVAALGASGRVYLGANLEIEGAPLYLAVHAEQAAVSNALSQGETELVAIALHAAPCGHCRQFLGELSTDSLVVLTPDSATTLRELAPDAFVPAALGNVSPVLRSGNSPSAKSDGIGASAREACARSYSPYTHSEAGVAMRLSDGTQVIGSYIESVAFNPSLDPFRSALSAAQFHGWPDNEVEQVALAHVQSAPIGHEKMLRDTIAWLNGPQVVVTVEAVDASELGVGGGTTTG